MSPLKLSRIAMQVLRRHLVISSRVAALQHRPKTFHAIRMGILPHILANAMPNGFMVSRYAPIPSVFVGVNDCIPARPILNKSVERLLVG